MNHPHRSNLQAEIQKLRDELQLAVTFTDSRYEAEGHADRVKDQHGIDLEMTLAEAEELAAELDGDKPTRAELQQTMRENEDQHNAEMVAAYERTFP